MDYLKEQIEIRRRRKHAAENEIRAAEAAIDRGRVELTVIEAELSAYLDIEKNLASVGVNGSDTPKSHVAALTPVAAPAFDNSPLFASKSVTRLKLQDELKQPWRGRYTQVFNERGEYFTTDDIVDATKGEANPPNRKSIRGVLSEHVQKGLMERISEGRFRFVFDVRKTNAFEAVPAN